MVPNCVPQFFSLLLAIICPFVFGTTKNNIKHSDVVNFTLSDSCPLGEPLRSKSGSIVRCNCPPHPFCPKLYYCKITVHGRLGICCPDFVSDKRHKIHPDETKLPVNTSSSIDPCSSSSIPNELCRKVVQTPKKDDVTTEKDLKETRRRVSSSKLVRKPKSTFDYKPVVLSAKEDPMQKSKTSCPEVSIPLVPPKCKLGKQRFDETGCPLSPRIICKGFVTKAPISPILVPQAPASRPRFVTTSLSNIPKAPGYKKDSKRKIQPGARMTMKPIFSKTKRTKTATTTHPPSPPPCPVFPVPPTLSPDCTMAPPQKDIRGCELPPEIVCEKRPTAYADVIGERIPEAESHQLVSATPSDQVFKKAEPKCPNVTIPIVQPGCRLLEPKYDDRGCMLLPEITCDPTVISKSNALECPTLYLPTMDPLCSFGPSRNDSNGCPMVPEIICPPYFYDDNTMETLTTASTTEQVTVIETKEPRIMSHCPYVPPPYLPPGCTYGVARYDEKGCSIAPDVICNLEDVKEKLEDKVIKNANQVLDVIRGTTSTFESPTTMFDTPDHTFAPIAYRNEFRSMLTAEFYHMVQSNVSPDAGTFRRTTSIPVVTSGRFHGCRLHADCFHFREPREWCDTGHPASVAFWTEKSCHCSEDTLVPACIVERLNRGLREWTFCADFSQCAANKK